MAKIHGYAVGVHWSAAGGEGTKTYRRYSRNHTIAVEGKPPIAASSDPAFRGDPGRYNPEELLVASLSSCHLLWYLHLCATNGVTVVEYRDDAEGTMKEDTGGAGEFVLVRLRPVVTVSPESDRSRALQLHHEAHDLCFIARSVKFAVEVEAQIVSAR